MEKLPKSSPNQEQLTATWSQELITGKLAPELFLENILQLDQSDPERKSSVSAAELLSSPEIVGMFEGSNQRESFYNIRSLSYFHRAQIRLSKGEPEAMEDLKQALEDSEVLGQESEDWSNYIRATIAYLNNDLGSLRELVDRAEMNKSLVRNFVQGLEERGYPEYLTDYAQPRGEEE